MPAIDKKKFLADISSAKPYGAGDDPQGMPDDPAEESGEMTCGEQLIQALGLTGVDPGPVDDALREAVAKYSTPAV